MTEITGVFILLTVMLYVNGTNGDNTYGEANIKNHPYQLQVRYTYHKSICGAVLLRPALSLTCANCVVRRQPFDISVGAGSSNFTKRDGIWKIALFFFFHPGYKLGIWNYNIAIIVTSPFPLSVNIQPIDLMQLQYEVFPNTVATATGYGLKNYLVKGKALRYATLTRIRDDDCYKLAKLHLTDRMLCFVDKSQNQLYLNDMGDPLVINKKLVGFAVSLHQAFEKGGPVLYLSVQHPIIRKFIVNIVTTDAKQLFFKYSKF
ncbi:hypothetical protein RN001_006155 [Aquatica leii]|uniref:Peptidase S1 domain-containing protein n=1 Tax=Aquatica leii TaxID=1421715 RepID=A0AAN7PI37_9COLE|nr:hypothetical protein RN001_006155 [Aquatica leii]